MDSANSRSVKILFQICTFSPFGWKYIENKLLDARLGSPVSVVTSQWVINSFRFARMSPTNERKIKVKEWWELSLPILRLKTLIFYCSHLGWGWGLGGWGVGREGGRVMREHSKELFETNRVKWVHCTHCTVGLVKVYLREDSCRFCQCDQYFQYSRWFLSYL